MQGFAKKLTARLISIDVDNSKKYQENYLKLGRKLSALKQNIKQILTNTQQPIASYSNAFGHFITENQLKQTTLITSKHEERLSIYKIIKAKKSIRSNNTKCLISTTGVPLKRIDTLTKGLNISTVRINIMGSEFNTGTDQYFKLMNNIANKVNQCLQ